MSVLQFAVDVFMQGQGIQSQFPTPSSFCLSEQEYNHDFLRMEYWGGNVNSDSLASGTPIQVNFGRPPTMRSFYGYVNHAGRRSNAMASSALQRNTTCVYAVGASWPLKEVSSAVYQNMTSTQIIQQIAAQFGLASMVVPSTQTWSVKQQGGQTYWQFCVQLAQEIGYTFFCDGIQLVAIPRQTNPTQLSSLIAIYDYTKNPSSLPIFNPTLGANNPTGGQLRNRQIAGVDTRTNQPFFLTTTGSGTPSMLGVVQDTPPFNDIEQFSSADQSQAMTKLQGISQLNQMYITAEATGPGNPFITPGRMIFVQNANGSQNGLWFISGVDHTLSSQTYVMDMRLGRDSIGQTASVSINPSITFPPTAKLLNNTTWVQA